MKAIKKITAVTGKYMKDGQEKNRYTRVGTLFQRDDGSLSIKIDVMPVGEFAGWLNCYDLDENRQQQYQQGAQQARQAAGDEFSQDIPF